MKRKHLTAHRGCVGKNSAESVADDAMKNLPRAHKRSYVTDILKKTMVLALNRNGQAINVRAALETLCMMATNVAIALDIELGDDSRAQSPRLVLRTRSRSVRSAVVAPTL